MSHAEGCRGQDGDSTARTRHVKVVGEEIKRQKALGLLITRQTWLDGALSGLGLSCCRPEPQLSPCPGIRVGGEAGTGQHAYGQHCLWGCGLCQAPALPLCLELFRQRCCREWSLPQPVPGLIMSCCWPPKCLSGIMGQCQRGGV